MTARIGLPPGVWTKARASDSASGCVEVCRQPDGYALRDTKDRGRGPVLNVPQSSWQQLRELICDAPCPNATTTVIDLGHGLSAVRAPDGALSLRGPGGVLTYTAHEIACFADGLGRGEFDPSPEVVLAQPA